MFRITRETMFSMLSLQAYSRLKQEILRDGHPNNKENEQDHHNWTSEGKSSTNFPEISQ
jgi:hypothetical protein